MQKKSGDKSETGGLYLCLYHLKNKLKIKTGSTFPRCDFAGLNCEGFWHLKKEIKEKSKEEKEKDYHLKRDKKYWQRGNNTEYREQITAYKKTFKWNLEKW